MVSSLACRVNRNLFLLLKLLTLHKFSAIFLNEVAMHRNFIVISLEAVKLQLLFRTINEVHVWMNNKT